MRSTWNSRSAKLRNFLGSETGSYITGSIGRPSTPPLALISSIASKVALSWVRSIPDVTPVCENSTPTRHLPVLSSINAIAALSPSADGGHFNLNEVYYLINAVENSSCQIHLVGPRRGERKCSRSQT